MNGSSTATPAKANPEKKSMTKGGSTLAIALIAIGGYIFFCWMYMMGKSGPVEAQTVGMILGEWKSIALLAFAYYLSSSIGSAAKDDVKDTMMTDMIKNTGTGAGNGSGSTTTTTTVEAPPVTIVTAKTIPNAEADLTSASNPLVGRKE